MKFSSERESTSIVALASAWPKRRTHDACRTCRLGHAGNGDAMLAYHLMDFSRYFFDQGDIRS